MEKAPAPVRRFKAAALEIRLRRPASFHEKLHQLFDKMSNKKGAR
jgi:hypothetical protein